MIVRKRVSIFWLILVGLVVLRIVFFYVSTPKYSENSKVRISTKVWQEPRVFASSQLLVINGLAIFLPKYPLINYGDYIVIEGTVSEGKLSQSRLINITHSNQFIFVLRQRAVDFYSRVLPSRDAALVSGMVLGSKSGIDRTFWEELVESGTAHVVVASGANVSLVGFTILLVLINFVTRRKAAAISILVIWSYVVLSGLEAPLIRAGIMTSMVFMASLLGKKAYTLRLLILTCLAMLIIKPSWIADLGFILSFAATFSLTFFTSKVASLMSLVPKIIKDSLAPSIAAQIGVAPILFLSTGKINLFSPIINVLVGWTITPITIVGMTAFFILNVSELLAKLLLISVYPLTSFFVSIVHLSTFVL